MQIIPPANSQRVCPDHDKKPQSGVINYRREKIIAQLSSSLALVCVC